MATVRIAEPTFAPLLLSCQQTLHSLEFREWMSVNYVYSVERHVLSPSYVGHGMRRP
jgi:hypothetical protein